MPFVVSVVADVFVGGAGQAGGVGGVDRAVAGVGVAVQLLWVLGDEQWVYGQEAAGGCVVEETCQGDSAQCPANALAPVTTECRASGAMMAS